MWDKKEEKSCARKKQRSKNNGWEREMDIDGLLEEKEEKRVNNEREKLNKDEVWL